MAILKRTVFFVSDGTGLTVEALGHSLLTQFEDVEFKQIRIPFLDSADKAHEAVARINAQSEQDGIRPIVFTTLVNDELAELRYQASIRPGFQESFAAMFPAPRQRWVDALVSPEEKIRQLPHDTLIIHGREDKVIPLETSTKLFELIQHAQLHVFGESGHWAQIEHSARFSRLLRDFFNE